MNITDVPQTPENMFTIVAVILGILFFVGIGYGIWKIIFG